MPPGQQGEAPTGSASAKALRRTGLTVGLYVLTFGLAVGLIGWGLMGYKIESRHQELEELTARARTMQATVDKLGDQYGKAQLSTCEGRPCIRIDGRLGQYGEAKKGEVYMVIYGY